MKDSHTILDLLSVLSFFGTVVGLFVAIWQIRRATESNKHLVGRLDSLLVAADNSISKLDGVAHALSTGYIGEFPDYVPYVADMLSRANKEILMSYIISTPCVFTAHNKWLDIKSSIVNALRPGKTIAVKAVFSDMPTTETYLREQFRSELADWSAWRSKPEFLAQLNVFIRRYTNIKPDASNLTEQEFIDCFSCAAKEEMKATYNRAEFFEISYRPQIYMWIVDGKEAVFVLQSVRSNFTTYAFRTSDQNIIKGLTSLHHEYCDTGNKIEL
jgi:hypothetical protein